MVVDFGRVVIKTDLQTKNAGLEDATQMELEERLYDRLHVDLSDLQLLFCDSGIGRLQFVYSLHEMHQLNS